MESDITVDILPQLGVCNLCLIENATVNLFSIISKDSEITYSSMILNCFNIDINSMELGDGKRVICDSCICKLNDCMQFKETAETSLRTLVLAAQDVKKEVDISILDNEFDFEDDEVLSNVIKNEDSNANTKTEMRDMKNGPICRNLSSDDFLNMFERGLFPFKLQKGVYKCAACCEKNPSLDRLRDHVLEHSEKYLKMAFKKTEINTNCPFTVLSNLNFVCKKCEAEISNFDEIKKHIDTCKPSNHKSWKYALPYELKKDQLDCSICKKRFLNFVSLNTHMNTHYPNFICESCGKPFASQARMRAHMRTHEVGEFTCKFCFAVFDRVTKRENHVSKEHKSGVRYTCKMCNMSLSSFYAKQKHLADVHNEDLKKYKCKACTQSYVTPGHLSSHVRRDHLNERNYKCPKCDLAFYTNNSLKMHMIKHGGERIHICPVCQKAYQRKKTLKEHMRIHNNDKRFVCPYCGRAFTQKCTLKGHLKVHDRKPDSPDIKISEPQYLIMKAIDDD